MTIFKNYRTWYTVEVYTKLNIKLKEKNNNLNVSINYCKYNKLHLLIWLVEFVFLIKCKIFKN